jgi:hypothetical protein
MERHLLVPAAWTTATLTAAALLLYAVGGVLDSGDALLLLLGAAPVAGFGMVAFGWSPRAGRA